MGELSDLVYKFSTWTEQVYVTLHPKSSSQKVHRFVVTAVIVDQAREQW